MDYDAPFSPLPPVDNHLLSTQYPSAVPISPLPGITLSEFAYWPWAPGDIFLFQTLFYGALHA
jgi:hypothetical protein